MPKLINAPSLLVIPIAVSVSPRAGSATANGITSNGIMHNEAKAQ